MTKPSHMRKKENISIKDFKAVDIRVGTVISAQKNEFTNRPAFILHIDFGSLGILKTSAQITELYQAEELIGKQLLAVVNFPPKQIAKMKSECLVLGLSDEKGAIVLVSPDQSVPNGHYLH